MNQLKPAPDHSLLDFILRAESKDVVVSAPLPGDATFTANAPADSPWVTMGVAAAAIPALGELLGQSAALFTSHGRRVCGVRLEKIDPRLNVIVGRRVP